MNENITKILNEFNAEIKAKTLGTVFGGRGVIVALGNHTAFPRLQDQRNGIPSAKQRLLPVKDIVDLHTEMLMEDAIHFTFGQHVDLGAAQMKGNVIEGDGEGIGIAGNFCFHRASFLRSH